MSCQGHNLVRFGPRKYLVVKWPLIFFPSSYGAVVFLVPTGSEMKCVLKSQMIRLLAYALPFIRDEDIIVTADVDAFVMTKG